jgi:hypothetical protein
MKGVYQMIYVLSMIRYTDVFDDVSNKYATNKKELISLLKYYLQNNDLTDINVNLDEMVITTNCEGEKIKIYIKKISKI